METILNQVEKAIEKLEREINVRKNTAEQVTWNKSSREQRYEIKTEAMQYIVENLERTRESIETLLIP